MRPDSTTPETSAMESPAGGVPARDRPAAGGSGDLTDLTRRLDRVERENRRLKLAAVVVLALAAVFAVMGQAQPTSETTIVEAQEYLLTDEGGNVRAALAVAGNSPVLMFMDENQVPQLQIGVIGGEPGLILQDPAGQNRAVLMLSGGSPVLTMVGENGIGGLVASLARNQPSMTLFETPQKVYWHAP